MGRTITHTRQTQVADAGRVVLFLLVAGAHLAAVDYSRRQLETMADSAQFGSGRVLADV